MDKLDNFKNEFDKIDQEYDELVNEMNKIDQEIDDVTQGIDNIFSLDINEEIFKVGSKNSFFNLDQKNIKNPLNVFKNYTAKMHIISFKSPNISLYNHLMPSICHVKYLLSVW